MKNEKLSMLLARKVIGFPHGWGLGGDIHNKIVERMKRVLQEDTIYTYLQPNAQQLLSDARNYARENGLLDSKMLPCSENSFSFAHGVEPEKSGQWLNFFLVD